MTNRSDQRRFRVGDRVDFNNGWGRDTEEPNNTPGRIRRVIVTRKYLVAWDDGYNLYDEPYEAHELIPIGDGT